MQNQKISSTLIACLILLIPLVAASEPYTHDGLFVRGSVGGGKGTTTVDNDGSEYKVSDTTLEYHLALGGMIQPDVAVHATVFGWSMLYPSLDLDTDSELAGSVDIEDANLHLLAVGPGVTYYFMEPNVYLSSSVGLSRLYTAADSPKTDGTGWAIDTSIGNEWWLTRGLGVGVAAGFSYHSVPSGDGDAWNGTSFGIRFCATLN